MRGRPVMVAVAVVVLLGAGLVLVTLLQRAPAQAPSLEKGPGVFRLLTERMPSGGQRPPYELQHDGASVRVVFVQIDPDDSGRAELDVRGATGVKGYEAGDTVPVDGGTLRVLAVHDTRTLGGDAVDVRLSGSS